MNALIALLALATVIAAAPAAALAQTGWVVLPSFTLAEEFDDNVFVSTTDPKSDFITRFTPGLQLGYRSEPFTLLVSSSIDAEIYVNNPELSDAANRKRAALEMKYLPFRLLTVSLERHVLRDQYPVRAGADDGAPARAGPGHPARHHPGGELPDHIGRYRDGVVRLLSRHAGRRRWTTIPTG